MEGLTLATRRSEKTGCGSFVSTAPRLWRRCSTPSRRGLAELPRDARFLGGRVREGLGEYYCQMMALTRTLEQNSSGNWVARYLDLGKADHYAHAEVYCHQALAWEAAGFLF